MSQAEDIVQQKILMEIAKHGTILLRNNSGALADKTGRTVRYGLGNNSKEQNRNFKSSDLVGICPIIIGPEHVGMAVGVFCAIEVKREGWKYKGDERETGQQNFIDWVRKLGGFAGFANSVEEALKIIGR